MFPCILFQIKKIWFLLEAPSFSQSWVKPCREQIVFSMWRFWCWDKWSRSRGHRPQKNCALCRVAQSIQEALTQWFYFHADFLLLFLYVVLWVFQTLYCMLFWTRTQLQVHLVNYSLSGLFTLKSMERLSRDSSCSRGISCLFFPTVSNLKSCVQEEADIWYLQK